MSAGAPAAAYLSRLRPSTLAASLAGLLTLCCMLPALGGGFLIWDDNVNLLSNPPLWQPAADAIRWMFTDIESVQRYKPITWLTWRLLGDIFGLNPMVFHAWNIFLHAINASLLFQIISNLFARKSDKTEAPSSAVTIAALFGTLSWSLHPLRVEPVAWISGAGYPLSTFFALLTLLIFQRQLLHDRPRTKFAALFFFALSLLSYPATSALPGLLLAFAILASLQSGTFPPAIKFFRLFHLLWPYAVFAAAVLAATLVVRFTTIEENWKRPVSLASVGVGSRLMQAVGVWGWYLEKTLVPWNLSPVYPDFWKFSPTGFRSFASLTAFVMISVGSWRVRRSCPEMPTLWGAFLLLSVPMLGLTEIPFSPADRYTYVPGIALSILAATLIHRYLAQALSATRRVAAGILAVPLILGMIASIGQLRIWSSPVVFFQHAIAMVEPDPAAADLHWRLGLHYLTMGETQFAQAEFTTTLRLNPQQIDAARYLRVLRQRAESTVNSTPGPDIP
jgi:hypothetical protein